MERPVSIILADDHTMFRQAISQLLKLLPGVQVIGEAANGKALVELARQWKPDIIFADINMPVMNGLEATSIIKAELPAIKIVALSMLDESGRIAAMMDAGADGYLLKNAGKEELKSAIEALCKGETYFCIETAKILEREKRNLKQVTMEADLTKREKEVLLLLCREMTNQQIAARLFISTRTVDGHRERIRLKTNTHNIAGLIFYAFRHGLIKL